MKAEDTRTIARKVRVYNLTSWLGFIGVVMLILVLWTPVSVTIHNWDQMRSYSAPERTENYFIALAYRGVEENPIPHSGNISGELFAEHLRYLRNIGCHPITLTDVHNFYKYGTLLPKKAILITFDEALRSTYVVAEDYLRQNRCSAVVGVNSRRIREIGSSTDALLWPYLRTMNQKVSWELAGASDSGFAPIPIDADGTQGHFFTDPMWIAVSNRYERIDEFRARLAEDHKKFITEFKQETGTRPLAFFYPFGSYGQDFNDGHFIRNTNLELVQTNYSLGFTRGQIGLNLASTDPRRLHRLQVNPTISARALVEMLEKMWPYGADRELPLSNTFPPSHWVHDWGEIFTKDNSLMLSASLPHGPYLADDGAVASSEEVGTTGARAWLAGSDFYQNGHFTCTFKIRRGEARFYFRHLQNDDFLAFTINEHGNANVLEHLPSLSEEVLASDKADADGDQKNKLQISLHDNRMYVRVNEKMLFNGPVRLRGESFHAGRVGVAIWHPVAGLAEIEILSTTINLHTDSLIAWQQSQQPDSVLAWLSAHANTYTSIAPPWIIVAENGTSTVYDIDEEPLRILTSANGMAIYPQMTISHGIATYLFDPDYIAQQVVKNNFDGILVRIADSSSDAMKNFGPWLEKLNLGLRASNKQLVIHVDSLHGIAAFTLGKANTLPGAIFARRDAQENPGSNERKSIAYAAIPMLDDSLTPAIFRNITKNIEQAESVAPEVRNETLRSTGRAAYEAGNFREAITAWTEWSKLVPFDPQPYALIGDANISLGLTRRAIENYRESLKHDAGQIGLVIRLSNLLDSVEDSDGAIDLLNLYDRTFPGNTDLIIAKAAWYDRHNQRALAREAMRELARLNPTDTQIQISFLNYLDDSKERYMKLRQILGSTTQFTHQQTTGFAQSISGSDLLTQPEAGVLFPYIRTTAQTAPSDATRKVYATMLPRETVVHENFAVAPLSEDWSIWGTIRRSNEGRQGLYPSATTREAVLRLKNSDLLRDGFLRVSLAETVGSFWLYARRSQNAMLRFGYDNDGYIRLQAWRNGQFIDGKSTAWLRPPGTIFMELEIRGDGVLGYINGVPMFSAPLLVPKSIAYGWWGMAPYTQNAGAALADIATIDAGPLPASIVILPQLSEDAVLEAQAQMRPRIRDISALAPLAFSQSPDGILPTNPEIPLEPYKMYCSFHRVRLMPCVDLAYYPPIDTSIFVKLIKLHNLDGLVVRVVSMPPKEWFESLAEAMEETSANIIVVQSTEPIWPPTDGALPRDEYLRLCNHYNAQLIEIPRGNVLIPPYREVWEIPRFPWQEWLTGAHRETIKGITPRLVVYPASGFVDAADLPRVIEEGKKARIQTAEKAEFILKSDRPMTPENLFNEPFSNAIGSITNAPPVMPRKIRYVEHPALDTADPADNSNFAVKKPEPSAADKLKEQLENAADSLEEVEEKVHSIVESEWKKAADIPDDADIPEVDAEKLKKSLTDKLDEQAQNAADIAKGKLDDAADAASEKAADILENVAPEKDDADIPEVDAEKLKKSLTDKLGEQAQNAADIAKDKLDNAADAASEKAADILENVAPEKDAAELPKAAEILENAEIIEDAPEAAEIIKNEQPTETKED